MDSRKTYKNLREYGYILARNENVKKELIEHFSIEEDKVSISYDFIPEKFHAIKGLKDNNKTIIGYINSFPSNKIIKLKKFIDVFKGIKDSNLEFRIYGSKFPLLDLIKDDGRIRYYGFLPEEKIVETYNTFNAYLSTSTVEGFGLPIMQAKACKIPVLCYDGNLPNISKRNTLLWDDSNLEDIIKNRKWEDIDIEKAHNDANECSKDNVISGLIKVYEKVFNP